MSARARHFLLRFSAAYVSLMATVALAQDQPGAAGGKMGGKMEAAESFDPPAPGKKPAQKFVEETRPPRDPKPVAGAIDRWVDAALLRARLPVSPQADDAEFLRRVTIDIVGRVPTVEEASAFLASTDAEKRARWVDELLASAAYGAHFATIWRELMLPRDNGMKPVRDEFSPWLAGQFSRNRGWDRIVAEMLTVEGKIRELPQSGFIMANSENGEPQPHLLADATARLFWGVQLRCAECHDHPFASWKQADFWGTAAFFSRLRKGYANGKDPKGWTLTEAAPDEPVSRQFAKAWAPDGVAGPAILVPSGGGKVEGKVVHAKYLGGADAGWTDAGPFRERFAQWATSAGNSWFSANTVNRLWAHFFTRGLVMPMDGFNGDNPPSHPEVLTALRTELIESGFDLKHLVRCICQSRAYQRSSRPSAGNERDEKWLSHHLVKVMRPEVLYHSLSTVLQPTGGKGGKKSVESAPSLPGMSREEFVRFFASRADDNEGSIVNQGIPQFLALMNGPLLNVARSGRTIDDAFLAAYSRKPTDDERRAVQDTLGASDDGAGLLWTLLNSAEFVTNR